MLSLRWFAANAGNPDAAAYANATDQLFAGDPPTPMQGFRRGDQRLADPHPHSRRHSTRGSTGAPTPPPRSR